MTTLITLENEFYAFLEGKDVRPFSFAFDGEPKEYTVIKRKKDGYTVLVRLKGFPLYPFLLKDKLSFFKEVSQYLEERGQLV